MDRLFQLRRDELRYAAFAGIEKRLGFLIKCALLLAALLITWFERSGLLRRSLFYVYLGVFFSGTLFYTYLYRRFSSSGSARPPFPPFAQAFFKSLNRHIAIITFSSCLETFCVSLIYYTLARTHLSPIAFFLLLLPILRVILFFPSVREFVLIAGSSSAVFLFVTSTLEPQQLSLGFFWACFASVWLILSLGAAIAGRLFSQFSHSVKNRQLILQALQMVSSLVEMAQSTAHLHEKRKILQRAVEIISRVMAVDSCLAWTYRDGRLYPAASEGLDEEQMARFQAMELSVQAFGKGLSERENAEESSPASDITIFERALLQKVPIVVTDDHLNETVPLLYRQCFGVGAMLVIPLVDSKRTLGCVALHWRSAPEKITSQELAILSGIATQIGITLENVYLLEELREKEEIRGRLLERLISIQEQERERIARELHDETGQILTALMVNVELLKTEPEFQSANSQERLEEISSLLSRTMEDIHSLSIDLHPKILSELGLLPAIRWYAKNHLERWGIDFNIVSSNLNHSLSAKEETCLFRVAQEAITNVIRHAHARQVDIEIGFDAESVYLGIKDDGIGFHVDQRHGELCLGLRSMEERVSFLGGQLDIRSKAGEGTEVLVSIPLHAGSDD